MWRRGIGPERYASVQRHTRDAVPAAAPAHSMPKYSTIAAAVRRVAAARAAAALRAAPSAAAPPPQSSGWSHPRSRPVAPCLLPLCLTPLVPRRRCTVALAPPPEAAAGAVAPSPLAASHSPHTAAPSPLAAALSSPAPRPAAANEAPVGG
jgi:hypothetical protein